MPALWNKELSSLRQLPGCYKHKYWQSWRDCLKKYKSAIWTAKRCPVIRTLKALENLRDLVRIYPRNIEAHHKLEGSRKGSSCETSSFTVGSAELPRQRARLRIRTLKGMQRLCHGLSGYAGAISLWDANDRFRHPRSFHTGS